MMMVMAAAGLPGLHRRHSLLLEGPHDMRMGGGKIGMIQREGILWNGRQQHSHLHQQVEEKHSHRCHAEFRHINSAIPQNYLR